MSQEQRNPRILLSNDDGINAPGLFALWSAMRDVGDVIVVAPDSEKSAVGHAITISDPLRVWEVEKAGTRFGYAVNGTPADCIKIAYWSLLKEKPDYTLVYGDTNSTSAGALAAKKLHGKVAHVEAGLRSFNMKMPEEINRILTDRISDLLFCPTDKAVENLEKEGFGGFDCRVIKSGDVMQDAALFYAGRAEKPEVDIQGEFIILTLHRAENTDDPDRFLSILEAVAGTSEKMPVVFPMHPRTKKLVAKQGFEKLLEKITVIDPVGYLEMIWLLDNCRMVMTDSGGLQKEAYFFKKPCVTLRDETEWVELVTIGVNVLAGSDRLKIVNAAEKMLASAPDYSADLYGNGRASGNIVRELLK